MNLVSREKTFLLLMFQVHTLDTSDRRFSLIASW